MEERRVLPGFIDRKGEAQAVINEFLQGPAGVPGSPVPRNAKLLGLYFGTDNILYVDLSDEFRRGFQGDALSEFLLLRGLYESLMSNVAGITDVKLLIDGKEIESLGGHMFANRALGELTRMDKGAAVSNGQ